MKPVEIKIAYLGGGSRGWAHILMKDLAFCDNLTGQVALYDIDLDSARLNERYGNWLQKQPGVRSRFRYRAVARIGTALKDADFVIASIQPGTWENMRAELAIGERYGIHLPVGDTVGPAGLCRAMRSVVIYQYFAEQISEHCPKAWVINYTNPMTVCTRTLTKVNPALKVFGCCHEVFGAQGLLAGLASRHFRTPKPIPRRAIDINVLGINHFAWITRAQWQGQELLALLRRHLQQPGVRRKYTRQEVLRKNSYFVDHHQIKFELFVRFGALGAAGDRHLAEFVPGFTASEAELFRWGIRKTPVSYRVRRWQTAQESFRRQMAGKEPLVLTPSGEEGVRQIQALLGLGDFKTNVNTNNVGQIPNLPLGAVVETDAYFSGDRVAPIAAGEVPPAILPLLEPHVRNQELIIEASLARETDLAFAAFFNDPLVRLPLDQARQMFDQMLRATRQFLPGFKIPRRR